MAFQDGEDENDERLERALSRRTKRRVDAFREWSFWAFSGVSCLVVIVQLLLKGTG